MSPGIILEYALFLICRDSDTIIFYDEIESFRSFIIRNNKVFNFDPMTDRVFYKVDENSRMEMP